MPKLEQKLYLVIDIRNNDVKWNGSKKDCKWWISKTNPYNRKFYKIIKAEVLSE